MKVGCFVMKSVRLRTGRPCNAVSGPEPLELPRGVCLEEDRGQVGISCGHCLSLQLSPAATGAEMKILIR